MEEVKLFIVSIWQNKRKRAALSLILWVIFFIIVFLMIGGPGKVPSEYYSNHEENSITSSDLDNFKNMSNYEYSYLVTIGIQNTSNIYKIVGTYYDGKYYFEMGNETYYIDNNVLYKVNTQDRTLEEYYSINNDDFFNLFDIRLLGKDNIYTFIDASTEENKTSYKDGSVVKEYLYQSYDNHRIKLVVSEYSNIINGIDLDFRAYFDQPYDEFSVSIAYKNINNIAEYNKNYNDYEIIKKGD